ncbi:DEAD/DEAH box helicase [Desulfoluna sp.]|uniref:DEAD/DEAH box helicase n=1 Tax=Desulfoluna sp. TaxID=2045199 RepID=UPI002619C1E8|nr:DEAD/DEAH box helicase [Desulfoluna sp.]
MSLCFEEFGLRQELVEAVAALGFTEPTPVQEKALAALRGTTGDLVALAQTGTGKTAAFGLPLINRIETAQRSIQAVVLCPTRELCIQISRDFVSYGSKISALQIASIYGGSSIALQIRQVKRGSQIIVATPGRLLDLMGRGVVDLSGVTNVVLDEADEMLNMGFKEAIDDILKDTPDSSSTWLFSATMPKGVAAIARGFMSSPVEITVGKKNSTSARIDHENYVVRPGSQLVALKRIIDASPDLYGLVFCRTRHETRQVADSLLEAGYDADALHGELSQQQRDVVMQRFRNRRLKLLVATDVAARGIDVEGISHVIHYGLPDEVAAYTHRSGRTARAGRSGKSLVIMNWRDNRKLGLVAAKCGIRFTACRVPEGSVICKLKLDNMVEKLKAVDVDHDAIGEYLPSVYEAFEALSKEELINQIVAERFNSVAASYKGAEDINDRGAQPRRQPRPERDRGSKPFADHRTSGMQRITFNKGINNRINQGAVIRLVCDRAGISSRQIGRIDIGKDASYFEVDGGLARHVFHAMKGATLDGQRLFVEMQGGGDSSMRDGRKVNRGGRRFTGRKAS